MKVQTTDNLTELATRQIQTSSSITQLSQVNKITQEDLPGRIGATMDEEGIFSPFKIVAFVTLLRKQAKRYAISVNVELNKPCVVTSHAMAAIGGVWMPEVAMSNLASVLFNYQGIPVDYTVNSSTARELVNNVRRRALDKFIECDETCASYIPKSFAVYQRPTTTMTDLEVLVNALPVVNKTLSEEEIIEEVLKKGTTHYLYGIGTGKHCRAFGNSKVPIKARTSYVTGVLKDSIDLDFDDPKNLTLLKKLVFFVNKRSGITVESVNETIVRFFLDKETMQHNIKESTLPTTDYITKWCETIVENPNHSPMMLASNFIIEA